ncbi:MAG: phosphatidate cytidylyltransferase [Aquificae bacterium]|nr:phosphatidate cytidylyltransferase [Aquificota bacterium]
MENLGRAWRRLLERRETAGLLVGVLTLAAAVLPPPLFAAALTLFAYGLGWELGRITGRSFLAPVSALTLFAALLSPFFGLLTALSAALAAGYASVRRKGYYGNETLLTFLLTLLTGVYAGLVPYALFEVKLEGSNLLLALIFTVWAADTAAYYAGKNFGRRKLVPLLSPGKTWEGLLAGLLAGTLVGTLSSALLQTGLSSPPIWLFAAAAAAAGDLFESFLKRSFGKKDSSDLLGSHGGLLDRFDGLLFAALAVASFV